MKGLSLSEPWRSAPARERTPPPGQFQGYGALMEKTPEGASPRIYLALDLGGSRWQLAFGDGSVARPRQRTIEARDLMALLLEIESAKKRFGFPADSAVVSVYEAGRDAFWLHRWLTAQGVDNVVVDPGSIEVDRRAKRAKTDKLDSEKMVRCLVRHHAGEQKVWRVVRVPSEEDEDMRRIHRERKRIQEELTSVTNRSHSLLATIGVKVENMRRLESYVGRLRTANDEEVPPHLRRELVRIVERINLLVEQLGEVEADRRTFLQSSSKRAEMVLLLGSLRGVGMETAWYLVMEVFAWREIRNRKQLGALAGLTGTPHNSDTTVRDQGISKAGNSRLRALMVEVSWQWLRYQPDSELTLWFQQRFANAGGRARKRGIVAVARKLLIALWRFVELGLVPAGADLKAEGAALR